MMTNSLHMLCLTTQTELLLSIQHLLTGFGITRVGTYDTLAQTDHMCVCITDQNMKHYERICECFTNTYMGASSTAKSLSLVSSARGERHFARFVSRPIDDGHQQAPQVGRP